jgi:hypothetical protein
MPLELRKLMLRKDSKMEMKAEKKCVLGIGKKACVYSSVTLRF